MTHWTQVRRTTTNLGLPRPGLATLALRRGLGLATMAALLLSTFYGQEKAKEDKEKNERRRAQLLDEMRGLAQQTKVQFAKGDRQVELVKDPVFRYDDQPRRFIDATMWVWTEGGRPVAFQKIEAKYHVENGRPQWGLCFASTADDLLSVQWTSDRTYRSAEPGIAFKALSEAPAVAAENVKRKRQLRELARSFSARTVLNP